MLKVLKTVTYAVNMAEGILNGAHLADVILNSQSVAGHISVTSGQMAYYNWAKTEEEKTYTFFSIPEVTKLTSKLFVVCLHWDIFFVLLH